MNLQARKQGFTPSFAALCGQECLNSLAGARDYARDYANCKERAGVFGSMYATHSLGVFRVPFLKKPTHPSPKTRAVGLCDWARLPSPRFKRTRPCNLQERSTLNVLLVLCRDAVLRLPILVVTKSPTFFFFQNDAFKAQSPTCGVYQLTCGVYQLQTKRGSAL